MADVDAGLVPLRRCQEGHTNGQAAIFFLHALFEASCDQSTSEVSRREAVSHKIKFVYPRFIIVTGPAQLSYREMGGLYGSGSLPAASESVRSSPSP